MQKRLDIRDRIAPLTSAKEILRVEMALEEADGIAQPSVNFSSRTPVYKPKKQRVNRTPPSRKTKAHPKASASTTSTPATVTSKEVSLHEKRSLECWICGELEHKARVYPLLAKFKVNTVSQSENAMVPFLLLAPAKLMNQETGIKQEINRPRDTGSELSMTRMEIQDCSAKVTSNTLAFSGAGSKGDSVFAGDEIVEFGREKIYLSMQFVETLPKGIGMIIGLDNDLTMVDLEDSLAKIRKQRFNLNVLQKEKKPKEPKKSGDNAKLEEVIKKHEESFVGDETYFPLCRLEPIPIDVILEAKRFKIAPHHISAEDEEMIQCEIAEMASKGFLKRVKDSKWYFSFLAVKEKGRRRGKKRTAVDFRRLNPMVRVIEHPIPICEEIIDQIPSGSWYFASLDEAKAYPQQSVLDPAGCLTIREFGFWFLSLRRTATWIC